MLMMAKKDQTLVGQQRLRQTHGFFKQDSLLLCHLPLQHLLLAYLLLVLPQYPLGILVFNLHHQLVFLHFFHRVSQLHMTLISTSLFAFPVISLSRMFLHQMSIALPRVQPLSLLFLRSPRCHSILSSTIEILLIFVKV
jgi:hypothetical protein